MGRGPKTCVLCLFFLAPCLPTSRLLYLAARQSCALWIPHPTRASGRLFNLNTRPINLVLFISTFSIINPFTMASRRGLNATDESAYAVGSEVRRDVNIARRYLSSSDLACMPDEEVLGRSLSVKSVISTTSSFARRSQHAASRPDLQKYIQIGAGLQGAVFEQVRPKPLK